MSDVAEETGRKNAWPTGIFAITLFTENLEQAREFYQNVFGLPKWQVASLEPVMYSQSELRMWMGCVPSWLAAE
jgi:catechol-2,3-dioxygenase